MNKNKHVVCLSDNGRVERIIDASGLEDLWFEYRLLADTKSKSDTKFKPIDEFLSAIKSMELRNRYNSHRNPKVFVWVCELTYGELWDKLEKDSEYFQLVTSTAKKFYKEDE